MKFIQVLPFVTLLTSVSSQGFPATCPPIPTPGPNATIGACPQDFAIIGSKLEPVHESKNPPTGFAVDPALNYYLTYPRNVGPQPVNVVIATSFTDEEPWPNAAIQNCTAGQNASECFVNVQNVVLDSLNQLWIVDSGIPPGNKSAVEYGSKIMSFNYTTRELIRTYVIPSSLYYDKFNANDVRINNTLGTKGWAFITDESNSGSIAAIDLDTGFALRRLYNTTYTRADKKYVGSYDGQPIYQWNGTEKSFFTTGSDGIALASGSVYWGVLASRRFYYVSQAAIINQTLTEEDVFKLVRDPGELASEQAGFTADDHGRVYMLVSEPNAIFYVDTLQSEVKDQVNQTPPGGKGLVYSSDYVVKTLVRNAQIQHADSAAIWDGYLYFCTNQLPLSPGRQYKNIDARKGPYRSYKVNIGQGRGPAV